MIKMDSSLFTVARAVMIALNPIFTIAAAVLIILGALVMTHVGNLGAFYPDDTETAAIVLVAAGCAVLAASIIRFVGSCLNNSRSWMLKAYMVLMFVASWVQLAGGIMAYAKGRNYNEGLRLKMIELRDLYYSSTGSDISKEAWDTLQNEFSCCGVDKYTEWGNRVPLSCSCAQGEANCIETEDDSRVYNVGCYSGLMLYSDFNYVLAGVAVTFFAFELLCVLCAFIMDRAFKHRNSAETSK